MTRAQAPVAGRLVGAATVPGPVPAPLAACTTAPVALRRAGRGPTTAAGRPG